MSETFRRELDEVIKDQQITVLFQPIFDIKKRRIHGYEALSRGPQYNELCSPLKLFAVAEQYGKLSELELICRKKAITAFAQQKLPGKLFLNVSPQVLLERGHPYGETLNFLESCGLSNQQVVVEITEQQKVDDSMLKQATNHYRRLGFDIAIDDLGAGHSGLRQWSELIPDIVKVDRYFIENCHMDMVKKAFLKSIVTLAKATGAKVIAEGIELEAELKLLLQLGISLCQGFHLERPTHKPSKQFPDHLNSPLFTSTKLMSPKRLNSHPSAALIR